MMLRDHDRKCAHLIYTHCDEKGCPGGAPVEGERIQWCTTHKQVHCPADKDTDPNPEPHCLMMGLEENRCLFVPALLVEVDNE